MRQPRPLLVHLLKQEKKRNASLAKLYGKALDKLLKGKLYIRKVGKARKANRYVYLSRRLPEQQHPESKYIGPVGSVEVDKVKEQIKDRGRLEAQLKSLDIEKKMIEKALAEYHRLAR